MKVLKKITKEEFKNYLLRNINIKDSNIYEEANNPNMIGIFQLTSGTAKHMVEVIKPSNFEELNACSAFARPGTMDFVTQYIKNRESKKSSYPKAISDILQETNSIILYQEQVMEVFNKIGGFTLEATNTIRGLMKKLGKLEKKKSDLDDWNTIIKQFQENAEKKGISRTEAIKIANDLLKMSSYSFNRSHSSAYSYVAIITLYLSKYFRKYFYSSVLHYEVNRDKYLLDRLRSVKFQGFNILPPDINKSSRFISPIKNSNNELIFGLEDIKYVGSGPAEILIKNQPYKDFIDFYLKIQGNRITIRSVRALISIGAFDSIYPNRKRLLNKINRFWEEKKSIKVMEKLKLLWNKIEKSIDSLPGIDTTLNDLKEYEREYLGFNFFTTLFSKEFMDKIEILQKKGLAASSFAEVTRSSIKVPAIVNSLRIFYDKNNKEMAFVELEDYTGECISIPIFQSLWIFAKSFIVQGKIHLINLYRNKKEDGSEQIMFGRSGFAKQPEIERFIKRLDNL